MKTREEARKAWVEALRSGEYKQGKEYLRLGDKYCCLGVACELAIQDGVLVSRRETPHDTIAYDGLESVLPSPVRDWIGLSDIEGCYVARNHRETSLAKRNDDGASFSKIADIIESAPKGLFE